MSPNPVTTRERLASPLTWHYVGLAVMILIVAFLAIRLGLDWSATSSNSNEALINKQIELKTLDVQTAPLRGLEGRVKDSRQQIKDFYARRIPGNYSSITGQYQQIMHFVNGLERDKTFFLIRSMAFTGQQGGLVSLRLRVSTWLRPADVPGWLPPTPPDTSATAPAAQEGE